MANVIAHWPGKDVTVCPKHLDQLKGVAAAMGIAVSISPAPDESICTNCKNALERKA